LPPRHRDTKDFILLFLLSILVPLWREEKWTNYFNPVEMAEPIHHQQDPRKSREP
jgi:hypothetical protein